VSDTALWTERVGKKFHIALAICLLSLVLALLAGATRVLHKGGTPTVSLSSAAMDFGIRPVGTSSSQGMITLTNTGSGPLTLRSFTITGGNDGDFGLSQNCPATLSAGANCTLRPTFTPAAQGPDQHT
jgi:hypothetical protein